MQNFNKISDVKIDDLLSQLCTSTTKKAFNTFEESLGNHEYNNNSTYKKNSEKFITEWSKFEEKKSSTNQMYQ